MSTVVCLLGMHRSGTSAVSRMLNLLGVDLGPAAALGVAGADNPKGYWEHRAFVEINDAILERFGGRWDAPPEWPANWASDPRLYDLRVRARQLIAEQFGGATLWGWKDPRTCLTLPFWQSIVGPMKHVLCLRNPLAVAESLRRRDGMDAGQAFTVWRHYVQESLDAMARGSRLVVFYEDLITDWPAQARRMAAFLGCPERADDPEVLAAIGEFLDETLCHHQSSMAALLEDSRIPLSAKTLYVVLRDEASRAAPVAADPAPAVAGESAAIAAVKAQRDLLAADIVSLADDATRLRRERQNALEELRSIHASRMWRFACAIWRITGALFPMGTRRRDLYDAIVPQAWRRAV